MNPSVPAGALAPVPVPTACGDRQLVGVGDCFSYAFRLADGAYILTSLARAG